jgi:hypothetical protein
MKQPVSDEEGTSVAGLPLPPLPPRRFDPRVITPEKIASAARMSEQAHARLSSGQMRAGVEYTQKDYTAQPDPENPGFLTNGLRVLQDTSEVENGIRYSIPCMKPSARRGRLVKRVSRSRGAKEGTVTSVFRVYDAKSTTELRYDAEALCQSWRTTGSCAHPAHRHATRRDLETIAQR